MDVLGQLIMTDRRNPTPAYLDEALTVPMVDGSDTLRGVAAKRLSTS